MHVLEVGRLAGEAPGVPRVVLYSRRQKSGVSVMKEWVAVDRRDTASFADDERRRSGRRRVLERVAGRALRRVGADGEAVLDVPGVHEPDARRTCASEPALHANSKSAQWQSGVAPIASATTVPDGFTA